MGSKIDAESNFTLNEIDKMKVLSRKKISQRLESSEYIFRLMT